MIGDVKDIMTNKYLLYEMYSSICVPEDEYKNLEEIGTIPKNIDGIFKDERLAGITKRDHGIEKRYIGQSTCDEIAKYGAKVFLETWKSNDYNLNWEKKPLNYEKISSLHYGICYGILFFDNFMVVASENKPTYEGIFKKYGAGIMPIAIPYKNVMNINSFEENYGYSPRFYGINIELKNNEKLKCYLFEKDEKYMPFKVESLPYLIETNWSFETNKILGINLSSSITDINYNLNKIVNELKKIRDKSIDFKKRKNILDKIFDKSYPSELEKNIYIDDKQFMELLTEYTDSISDEYLDVTEALNKISNKKKSVFQNKKRIEEDLKRLNKNLDDLNVQNKNTFFLKRGGVKKNIKKIEEQIKNCKEVLHTTKIENALYEDAIDKFYKIENSKTEDKEKIELAKKVYNKCVSKNVRKLETKEEKIIFETICNQLNVKEKDKNKTFFNLGKKHSQVINKSDNTNQIQIMSDIKYNLNKENSKLKGIVKYLDLDYLKESINDRTKSSEELFEALNNYGNLLTKSKAVKSDWAIAGGIADGLAGSAAGLATAIEVQNKNAKAEQAAAENRENGKYIMQLAGVQRAEAQKEIGKLKKISNFFENKLCDVVHTEMYFDYLTCKVTSYKINKVGYFELKTDIKLNKEAEFNGIPIIVDGSIKVEIYDDNNKLVGDAYICADGFESGEYYSLYGFNHYDEKNIVIGKLFNGKPSKEITYNFKFVPISIWIIEK